MIILINRDARKVNLTQQQQLGRLDEFLYFKRYFVDEVDVSGFEFESKCSELVIFCHLLLGVIGIS